MTASFMILRKVMLSPIVPSATHSSRGSGANFPFINGLLPFFKDTQLSFDLLLKVEFY